MPLQNLYSTYKFVAKSLIGRWKKAIVGLGHSKPAFEELSDRLKPEWLEEWREQEAHAVEERGKSLRIYDVTLPNGRCLNSAVIILLTENLRAHLC